MDNSFLLESKNVTKSYAVGDLQQEILHGVQFQIKKGETVAITGPSGAGKSTFLHLIGLMDRPTTGEIWIDHQPTHTLSHDALAKLRNRFIGFLFQFHHLLPELTALENVMVPLRLANTPYEDSRVRAQRLLDKIGLQSHASQKPSTLSGGEQQRVALARALVNEPKILLADEPTGNLDLENGRKMMDLLWDEAKQREMAIIVVTHQESLAKRANRIVQLYDGKIMNL